MSGRDVPAGGGEAGAASGSAGYVVIACVYPDNALPSAWFQAVQRARRTINRAGYLARVDLVPASGVPGDSHVVVTTGAVAAGLSLGSVELVLTEAPALTAAFDELVARLVSSGRLARGPEPPRTIAIHRGFQAVGERARLPE